MTIGRRLKHLESQAATLQRVGICTHAAFVRLVGDATDEERRQNETPALCDQCGLPRVAGIRIILPAKMTPEAWEAKFSTQKGEAHER